MEDHPLEPESSIPSRLSIKSLRMALPFDSELSQQLTHPCLWHVKMVFAKHHKQGFHEEDWKQLKQAFHAFLSRMAVEICDQIRSVNDTPTRRSTQIFIVVIS